jgi:tetratricopeptide (TPR) repeat protein
MKLGWGYFLMGDLERAKECSKKGFEIHKDVGLTYWLCLCSLILGMIHFDSGDLKSAQNCVEEAVESSENSNEKHIEGISRICLGRILGETDPSQWNKGEACILEGIKILETLKIKPFFAQGCLFLGELYSHTGQKEKALENLKKAGSMFQEMGMDYWLARTYAVYAELFKREGNQSRAREKLGKAIEILTECGADGWVEKYEKELAALS